MKSRHTHAACGAHSQTVLQYLVAAAWPLGFYSTIVHLEASKQSFKNAVFLFHN